MRNDCRYQMPISFGPAPGSRQMADGSAWTEEEAGLVHNEWIGIRCRTTADRPELLPLHGFKLRGEPVIRVFCL